jgi:hypothetical protein
MNSVEKDKAFDLRCLDESLELFEAWRCNHVELLKPVGDSRTRQEQIIALRRATVDTADVSQAAEPFLLAAFSDEDKRILASKLFPKESFGDVISDQTRHYVFSNASSRCFRIISLELGDAAKGDWFNLYCDLNHQLIEHAF